LDAGYGYAYYDPALGDLNIDLTELQKELGLMQHGPNDTRPVIKELLETSLPGIERDLKAEQSFLQTLPPDMLVGSSASMPAPSQAIIAGERKYTMIRVPILAIFAVPHDMGPSVNSNPALREAFDAREEASVGAQATSFGKGLPSARVVRLPHANHFVFRSNEADVLREMNAFISSLP
jgi:pimeloyl-ACP methyl ester carboxylesterase